MLTLHIVVVMTPSKSLKHRKIDIVDVPYVYTKRFTSQKERIVIRNVT